MLDFAQCVRKTSENSVHLFYLGQAGFIIKNKSGRLFVIDPYLSDCVERVEGDSGFKRLLPKILSPNELDFDILLCTHFHRDHYDVDSVPAMVKENTTLLCPEDCLEDIKSACIKKNGYRIVKPGDEITKSGYTVKIINCDHGTAAPFAVGAVVKTDGLIFAFTGDTCLRLDRVKELNAFGKVNVLVAPINGKYGNMNSADCLKLSSAVSPDILIPCHFGMFSAHGGNPDELRRFAAQKSNIRIKFMNQGESISF